MDVLGSMMRDEKRTVMLTGHSLGGALATLCALDVRLSLGLDDDEILTVSSVRQDVGIRIFKWCTISWYRFTGEFV